MKSYYVRFRGKVIGPFGLEQLLIMQGQGRLSAVHEVSVDRMTWIPVSAVPELSRTGEAREAIRSRESPPLPRAQPVAAPPLAFPQTEAVFTPEPSASEPTFRAWEDRLGWGRVGVGLTLLLAAWGVAAANCLIVAIGLICGIAGESQAGVVFAFTIGRIGFAIVSILEGTGAGFCACVPARSSARGFGVCAFVLLLLFLLLSIYPSVYLAASDLAPLRNPREMNGVLIGFFVLSALSFLVGVSWKMIHLYYLNAVEHHLKGRDAGSLALISLWSYLGAAVVVLSSVCVTGIVAQSSVGDHFDRRTDLVVTLAIVMLFALATCLWVGHLATYLLALLSVRKAVLTRRPM